MPDEFPIGDLEGFLRKSLRGAEGVGQRAEVEPSVLLSREFAEPVESEPLREGVKVDQISRQRPAKEGEHLVGGELLGSTNNADGGRCCRADTHVVTEVHLGRLRAVADPETSEATLCLLAVNLRTRLPKGSFEHRKQFRHGRRTVSEEVEISGLPVDQPTGDQGGPAG